MDATPALLMIQNNMLAHPAQLYVIESSDHHLYLDNPVDLVYKLFLEVFGGHIAAAYKEDSRAFNIGPQIQHDAFTYKPASHEAVEETGDDAAALEKVEANRTA
jgi:hypothetical protein